METEGKNTKLRYGTVNFERRRHPRINVDLPIEYARSDWVVKYGHAINASEDGYSFREGLGRLSDWSEVC